MYYLAPIPKQFVDSSGVPYSNGTVEVYLHGDTHHAEVYLDADGETIAPNPVRLDSHGSWIGYVLPGIGYDYIVKDKNGNVIFSYEKAIVGGGDGGGGSGPKPDELWGHWLYEGSVFNIGISEVDVSSQYVKVEGNIGGEPSDIPGPIHLPKGLYDFKLQVGFLAGNGTGYKWFDLKIKYGDQELRAMTFEFNDVVEQRWMDEFGCGVFKMEQEGDITITLRKIGGSSGNAWMRVPHFFIHAIDSPETSGSSAIVDAKLPIRVVDGKVTNNGANLTVLGKNAWAEGDGTISNGVASHSEGLNTVSSGNSSHSEGMGTTASGDYTHSEGFQTKSTEYSSHAEGNSTEATANSAHSEGTGTKASAMAAHAEGGMTKASGQYSHAEGYGTEASADYSHASGVGTRATARGSTAVGKYNEDSRALFSVGEGTSDVNRRDAFKVDENGNTWMKVDGELKKFFEAIVSGTAPISVTVSELNEYNRRVFNISIPDGSIGKQKLNNWHYLVPDSRYVKFIDLGGNAVVSLEPGFLETLQSDWAQTDVNALDFIKNKPTIPPALSAGDGIGISSNVISRKVQFVTTDSTYLAIRHVLDEGDVPVLDVANGSYHNYFFPTHKSGEYVDFVGSMGYTTHPTYNAANYFLKYTIDNNNTWTVTKFIEQADWAQSDEDAQDFIKNKPAVMVHDAVQKYGSTWTGEDNIQIFGGRMTLKIEATTEGADPYKKVKFYLKANRGYHGADSWTCVSELFELSGGSPNIFVNMLDGTDDYKSLSNGPGSTIEFPSDAFNAMLRLEIDYDYANGSPQNKRSHGTVYVQRGTTFMMVSTRYEESV